MIGLSIAPLSASTRHLSSAPSELSLSARGGHLVWFELSIIPFVLAVLAVELAIERGLGGEPEELALRNRTLQALALAWILLLLIGIYS